MPYPSQIDPPTAVAQARDLIERDGYDAVSLSQLATVLGVKAPSLYRHFASKADLIRAVNTQTQAELVAALLNVRQSDALPPLERLLVMAQVYRAYAHAHPRAYMLAMGTASTDEQLAPQTAELLALPLQAVVAQLVGDADAHLSLRGLWALLHGFVSLEINGQFRRSGDLNTAFDDAMRRYLTAWLPPAPP